MSQAGEDGPAPADAPDAATGRDAGARTLLDDLAGLNADARRWAEAELAYHKARAAFVGAGVKRSLVLGVVAAVLAVFALFALVFGLILALSPLITPWGATSVVVGALLVAALACLTFARQTWVDVSTVIRENGQAQGPDPAGDGE